MKYLAVLLCLVAFGCSKKRPNYNLSVLTQESIPQEAPTEAAPVPGTYYVYSGGTLILKFADVPAETPEYRFEIQMFAGQLIEDQIGKLSKETLRGGAMRVMRVDKKTNQRVEVGRVTGIRLSGTARRRNSGVWRSLF